MFVAIYLVGSVVTLYYAQMWGLRRTIGPWGGILLVVLLGPFGLLAIFLFPKVEHIPAPRRRAPSALVPARDKPRPTPRPKVSS